MEPIAIYSVQVAMFTVLMLCGTAMAKLRLTPPPLPLMPIPSHRQLVFQRREQAMFFHFGVNTFTGQEQGDGSDDPSIFNPEGLDARQWVREAKNAGFKIVILTAKHADGFCLWPTAYSNYSVRSSPWKNGTGDVVREVANAAREEGLEFGLYLSPWDRHEPCYGDTLQYNEFYLGQLHELLTNYGPVSEVWLDGNKGPDTKNMTYLFDSWFAAIHQMQPNANIFSDDGPDIRWVGDETGEAGTTNWSMMNRSLVTIGGGFEEYLNVGDEEGLDWVPPECDVSIRPGWFWKADQEPRSVDTLLDIYYKSVGRNCVLLLNTPPNRTGLLHETDVVTLRKFKAAISSVFSRNLASKAHVTSSSTRGSEEGSDKSSPFRSDYILSEDLDSYWTPQEGLTTGYLQLDLGCNTTFNVVKLQEAVHMGQRVQGYHVEVMLGGTWRTVFVGTTIGYKKLDRIESVQCQLVRVVIDKARASPLIATVGLYLDMHHSYQDSNSKLTNVSVSQM